tara:strand:- start:285 stop:476 length:192 start_codon:yes stop_codon:yes gene_type:complete
LNLLPTKHKGYIQEKNKTIILFFLIQVLFSYGHVAIKKGQRKGCPVVGRKHELFKITTVFSKV